MALPRSAGVGKGWPVASQLAIIVTPAPPATLSAPQITKTSAAGSNPMTLSTTLPDNIDHTPNKIRGQRASNAAFTSDLVSSVTQLDENLIEGKDIPLAILNAPMPVGPNYVRLREENADGSTVSDWSNVVTDTYAETFWTADPTAYTVQTASGSGSFSAVYETGYTVFSSDQQASAITVDGASATLLFAQDFVKLWGIQINTRGTKTTVLTSRGGDRKFETLAKGTLKGANTTPVATGGIPGNFDHDSDHHVSPALAVPAGGIIIGAIYSSNTNFTADTGTSVGGAASHSNGDFGGMLYALNNTSQSANMTLGWRTKVHDYRAAAFAVFAKA